MLAFYNFYKNPDIFLEKYQKIEPKDTYQFVYEGGTPAYHKDSSCEKISSSFQNIKIPEEIQEGGPDAVAEFRKWFKRPDENKLYYGNHEAFVERMNLKFKGLLPSNPEQISYKNSGQEYMENVDLDELKLRIDSILDAVSQFISNSDEIVRKIIVKYDKHTYFANKDLPFPTVNSPFTKDIPIFDKNIGMSEEELRAFLKDFEVRFKLPVANNLKTYYRIKFNPELEFEGKLLEQLGFRKCSFCFAE